MKIDMKSIDSNLVTEDVSVEADRVMYSIKEAPFRLYGLYEPSKEEDMFRRMPASVAEAVNPSWVIMNAMLTGARARFKTDSEKMWIKTAMPSLTPLTANGVITADRGFDLYIKDENGKERYYKSFRPPVEITDGYEAELPLPAGMKDITLYFPIYSQLSDVWVSLQKGASLFPGSAYPDERPVCFFGSSITQGCCVTRSGNTYVSILSRLLDTDILNIGCSGGAKGQIPIAEYIGTLSLRAFVYDYDHNAPNAAFLKETHAAFFDVVRKAQPDLPIIMLSKPDALDPERALRRDVIRETYETAKAAGDENVYFIDGAEFFDIEDADVCTADGTHPNDFGHLMMAKKIAAFMKEHDIF